jgi:hypothetical protein
MDNNKSKPPSPWRQSKAKDALRELLESDVDGRIHSMSAEDVYKLSPLFQVYKLNNFKTNLGNLKHAIADNNEAVRFDHQALDHDKARFSGNVATTTPRKHPRWETSAAKCLLERDIQESKHKDMKPKEFWESRPEFKKFPLEVFRGHIYQEEYAQKGRSYWMHKKKMKRQK